MTVKEFIDLTPDNLTIYFIGRPSRPPSHGRRAGVTAVTPAVKDRPRTLRGTAPPCLDDKAEPPEQ